MKRQTMYLRMVTASLARRRSRMLVALLAVVVGATVLCGLVTIYIDMPRQMGMQFRSYGANMILVPGEGADGIDDATLEESAAVIDASRLVGVAPYHYEAMTINDTPIIAAGTDLEQVKATSPYWYVNGEWPDAPGELLVGLEQAGIYDLEPGDTVTLSYVAAADDAGAEGVHASDDSKVTKEFSVVGTLDTGGNEEGYFFMSKEDMAEMVGDGMTYDFVELSIQAQSDELDGYAEKIEVADLGVTPQLVKRVAESEATVLSKLQALVLLVTVIVLALTMICVATTMTAVVTERRKEIGLRKALGASDKSITLEFMGEGLLLGAIGGLVGCGLGFLFAQMVSNSVFNSTIAFMPWLIPLSVVVAVAVTALACAIPVRNATKVDPALVLKGE